MKRTQVDVMVRTGETTSRTSLHVPELTTNSSLQLQLSISTVTVDAIAEPDTSALMQTTITKQQPLLRLLTPEARRRVLYRVLRDLRALLGRKLRECITLLREQHDLSQLLEAGTTEGSTMSDNDEMAEHTFIADIADLHIQHLQAHMDQCFDPPREVDVDDILQHMLRLQGSTDRSTQRLHAQQDRLARRRCLGTETQTLKLANQILDEVQEFLYQYEGTDRADLLRDLVTVLINEVQTTAAKLTTLLHLVGHYIPQPYAVSETTSMPRMQGRNYAKEIIDVITDSFEVDATQALGGGPFGISDILGLIPALSNAATHSMIFLEDGQYDLENVTTPTDLPGEDTQSYENPALVNAPPGLCHRQDIPTTEEDAMYRAIQASRRADLEHREEDEHEGTTTMVGGATSSTSRTSTILTTPAMSKTRRTTTKTSSTSPTGSKSSTSPTGRMSRTEMREPRANRERDVPKPTPKKGEKQQEGDGSRPPESKKRRSGQDGRASARGTEGIRKYLGDT